MLAQGHQPGLLDSAFVRSCCTSQKCSLAPQLHPPETHGPSQSATPLSLAAENVESIKYSKGHHLPLLLTPPTTSGLISFSFFMYKHNLGFACFMKSKIDLFKFLQPFLTKKDTCSSIYQTHLSEATYSCEIACSLRN